VKDSDIQFALHGGRAFHFPREIGVGTQSGADIRVYATTPSQPDLFRINGKATSTIDRIEGFDVVAAEFKPPHSLPWICFTSRPFPNVEISASSRHYLRQILRRIKNKPSDRAFPDNLSEWATIDVNSDCWALRHFDKASAPFDRSAPMTPALDDDDDDSGMIGDTSCIGFTFSGNRDGAFKVNSLGGNAKTRQMFTAIWTHNPEEDSDQFSGTGKVPKDHILSPLKVTTSADKKVTTVSGKTTPASSAMLNLMLMNQLGYQIAI